jgi:hypothetical protein
VNKNFYTEFHDLCCNTERIFGNQTSLKLKHLDTSIIRRERLLDFGSGKCLNGHLCSTYITVDSDESLQPMYTSIDDAYASLRDNSVDAIIANQSFEHIQFEELPSVIAKMHAMLVDGGHILITIPNIKHGTCYFEDIDHKSFLSYYHVAALLTMGGFSVVDAYRYTKNMNALMNIDETTRQLFSFLEFYYKLDPAMFIAVVGKKHA